MATVILKSTWSQRGLIQRNPAIKWNWPVPSFLEMPSQRRSSAHPKWDTRRISSNRHTHLGHNEPSQATNADRRIRSRPHRAAPGDNLAERSAGFSAEPNNRKEKKTGTVSWRNAWLTFHLDDDPGTRMEISMFPFFFPMLCLLSLFFSFLIKTSLCRENCYDIDWVFIVDLFLDDFAI